jgi:hypothetical protein
MKSDDVCATYAKKKVKLTVRLLDDQDVLIEGTSEALEFLGKLLLAHAADKGDGFHLGPRAAGSIFFSPESTKGIYLHRLPCLSSASEELGSIKTTGP